MFGKQIKCDKKKLAEALQYLESPHEAKWDLSDVPECIGYVLGLFEPDYDYLSHHEEIEEKGITYDKMTWEQLRTMFTFINRGERFCDGFIAGNINDGTLLCLLKRVKELIE